MLLLSPKTGAPNPAVNTIETSRSRLSAARISQERNVLRDA